MSQYYPTPSQPYAQQYAPPPGPPAPIYTDDKGGYERFKPKKRINDPIFLILFVAQVSCSMHVMSLVSHC